MEGLIADRYVQGDSSVTLHDAVFSGFTHGMGAFKEIAVLLVWMKEYNKRQSSEASRVHLLGYDRDGERKSPSRSGTRNSIERQLRIGRLQSDQGLRRTHVYGKGDRGCRARATNSSLDRGFAPSFEQREARRRRILSYFEEEQRSDATKIGAKPTGNELFVALEEADRLNEGELLETADVP